MMRLTLRTLLAYLDDMLEPADTKIIGQKIQESPMAQLLVSRIREVMRRRRLKAPDVTGPEMGIDPNIIAQYLDNTLAPERYADVERVLLASDEMLAEAASCHEVLTVDPPGVALAMRERLYALGPVDVDSQLIVPSESHQVNSSRTPHSVPIRNGLSSPADGSPNSSSDQSKTTRVPDYLKTSPWTRRAFPSIIVALLILVSAVLLAPEFLFRMRQANNEIKRIGSREKEIDGVTEPIETSTDATNDSALIASRTKPPSPTTALNLEATKPIEGLDPVPPNEEDEDAPVPAPSPGVSMRSAKGVALTESADEVPTPQKFKPTQEPTPGPPPAPNLSPIPPEVRKEMLITYSSSDGVLIRLDATTRHWMMVPHRSAMQPGELVASIEPFESIVDFGKGGIRTTLVGETVASLLPQGLVAVNGWQVERGRIVIQSGRQAENEAVEIAIAIGEDVWKLELTSNETLCGLEVIPRQPSQFQKIQDDQWYQATLYVVKGTVKWTSQVGKTQEISEQLTLNIIPEKNVQVRWNPVSTPSMPDWCDNLKRKAMLVKRHQSQIQFEKTFELEQPVEEAMLNLIRNSKSPKIAELATQCLAAIEDAAGLVEALAECPHEEARFAAREGLRNWLPAAPDRGLILKDELDMHYPPAEADAIYRMLWGFSREDVINSKANSWQFIDWMRSPKTEIRELADYWVERLTEKKTDYRAQGGTAAQRESHVRRLEELIERNNGLIKGP